MHSLHPKSKNYLRNLMQVSSLLCKGKKMFQQSFFQCDYNKTRHTIATSSWHFNLHQQSTAPLPSLFLGRGPQNLCDVCMAMFASVFVCVCCSNPLFLLRSPLARSLATHMSLSLLFYGKIKENKSTKNRSLTEEEPPSLSFLKVNDNVYVRVCFCLSAADVLWLKFQTNLFPRKVVASFHLN